jgi:hypothetical protein
MVLSNAHISNNILGFSKTICLVFEPKYGLSTPCDALATGWEVYQPGSGLSIMTTSYLCVNVAINKIQ